MKTKRIFTLRLALYLTEQGFKPIKVIPDVNKPDFNNWLFEDTDELEQAISEYKH